MELWNQILWSKETSTYDLTKVDLALQPNRNPQWLELIVPGLPLSGFPIFLKELQHPSHVSPGRDPWATVRTTKVVGFDWLKVGKMRRPSSQITATDTADFSRRFLWNLRNINHSHLMAEKKIPLPVGPWPYHTVSACFWTWNIGHMDTAAK